MTTNQNDQTAHYMLANIKKTACGLKEGKALFYATRDQEAVTCEECRAKMPGAPATMRYVFEGESVGKFDFEATSVDDAIDMLGHEMQMHDYEVAQQEGHPFAVDITHHSHFVGTMLISEMPLDFSFEGAQ